MTKDAKKVIEQGFMFRCNSAGATGYGLTPFENCLQYETEELGNRDIYYTIRDIYSIYVDMRKSPKRINPVVLKAAANYFIALINIRLRPTMVILIRRSSCPTMCLLLLI